MIVLSQQGPGTGHPHRGGYRRGCMAYGKGIAHALPRLGKAGKTSKSPERIHSSVPTGQHFMAVTLVAHIKDDPIPLRRKNPVKGHGEFHCPQIGGQVPSPLGNHLHQTLPKLAAKGLSFGVGEQMKIIWYIQQGPILLSVSHSPGKEPPSAPADGHAQQSAHDHL